MSDTAPRNIWGEPLQPCCTDPLTGFYRDGLCRTGPHDTGRHVICAEMTDAFLQFTLQRGNDLITPKPEWNFPGLKSGDYWCLCALRWKEALEAGMAPPVRLSACAEAALQFVSLDQLIAHAI